MKFRLTIGFLCVALFTSGFQPRAEDPNDPQLARFQAVAPSDEALAQIGNEFEIVERDGRTVQVILPYRLEGRLRELAPQARLIEADISEPVRRALEEYRAAYHNFASVETHLRQLAATYPQIATLEQYGQSKEGRPLYALKVSDNPQLSEAEPGILLTAATHGNELITVEVLFGLLDTLLSRYATDSRVQQIVENRELYFVPVVNPDGYVRQQRYANGVDPNREYPWPQKPQRQPNECIAALMGFFHQLNIRGSIDFHSHGRLIMYPWAWTASSPESADDNAFDQVTRYMAQANGYRPGQISKILYPAPGSSADYYYWKNRTLALGIEIGGEHVPSPAQITQHVRDHYESTLRFIETVRR